MLGPVITCMRCCRAERGVVGNEAATAGFGQPRFDHRVAADSMRDARFLATSVGAHQPSVERAFGRSVAQHVEFEASATASRVSGGTNGCSWSSSLFVEPFLARQGTCRWALRALSS